MNPDELELHDVSVKLSIVDEEALVKSSFYELKVVSFLIRFNKYILEFVLPFIESKEFLI